MTDQLLPRIEGAGAAEQANAGRAVGPLPVSGAAVYDGADTPAKARR